MRKVCQKESTLLDSLAWMFPDSSRTTLRQMLAADRIRVNGAVERNARRELTNGDVIDVASKAEPNLLPPSIQVLHEDDDLIVVVKASGLLTVASLSERDETVQAHLNRYLFETRGSRERIHVVHRLDRDSSGVLVFAKSFEIREALKERFAEHDIERIYVAICEGKLDPPKGTIRTHVKEDATYTVRSVPASTPDAKLAVTHYRTIAAGRRYSMVEVTLETGKKNQIRVHLSEKGNPIIGDERYGAASDPIRRLGLHAKFLGFVHPRTGKKLVFTAPVPDSFQSLRL